MKKNKKQSFITGVFTGHARGFGFVTPDAPDAPAAPDKTNDIFIPPERTRGALNGDTVACTVLPSAPRAADGRTGDRVEGEIVKIIKRGHHSLVGTFYTERRAGYIIPMDGKIPYRFYVTAAARKAHKLTDGLRVQFKTPPKKAESDDACVEVEQVLGHMNDPGVDVLSLVISCGVPYEFPDAVLAEAERLPNEVSEAETQGRLDLRDTLVITIDGDDTKDIDDAVSLRMTPEGFFELGVHIADVTHYVREGSPLDTEALKRGTSIYPADRVIPMLPHKLSNGICSLNEDEDRLTLSCIITVDNTGRVVSHILTPSVIRSRKRFTYDRVQELLSLPVEESPAEGCSEADVAYLPLLRDMDRLRTILLNKRMARGALEFNFPEAKIRVDEDGRPISIQVYEHNAATGMIEEFMILCNETVAARFFSMKAPFVYRSHEEPEAEKIQQLAAFVQDMGYRLRGSGSAALRELLSASENTPEAYVIGQAVLRSMRQARYTPDDPFHFGLAAKFYCHFTSPIRRYPDLQIHRIIHSHLCGTEGIFTHYREILPDVCRQCSRTERTAEQLEREVAQLKKTQYMKDKEGRAFEGMVSGVTAWGVYVALPDTVEGLIPADRLKRKTLRVGDRVEVVLTKASIEERKIWFDLA